MSTSVTVDPIDELAYRLRFTSDEPAPLTFRVLVDGVAVGEVASSDGTGEFLLSIAPGTDPFVEILDRPETRPTIAFSGYCLLAWDAVAGAESYRVEQEIASVWTALATLVDDGRPVFLYQTPWLADGGIYPFRIVPVSRAGNDGPVMERQIAQIRAPAVPNVAYTFSADTKTVTIASA